MAVKDTMLPRVKVIANFAGEPVRADINTPADSICRRQPILLYYYIYSRLL